MTFKIDTNRGEAVIGPTRVEICAIGNKGYLRIGGEDGPVLRQITFGERNAAHRDSCNAAKYADFLSAAITHRATVSPGAGERNIIEIIALHLAGAGNDAPPFTETAQIVLKATGWAEELIDSYPAAYIDSVCMQISGHSKPWRTILLAPSKEESLVSLKHHLAISILKRGNGSSVLNTHMDFAGNDLQETASETFTPDKRHVVNEQKTHSKPEGNKENYFVSAKMPEDKILSNDINPHKVDSPKQRQSKKHTVLLDPEDDGKEVPEFKNNSYTNGLNSDHVKKESDLSYTASSFNADENPIEKNNFLQNIKQKETKYIFHFRSEAIKKPAKMKAVQTAGALPDETGNGGSSTAGSEQTGILRDKHNEPQSFKQYETGNDKISLKTDAATSSLESSTSFPSLVISLGKDKAPLISSAKKSLKRHNFIQGQAVRKISETVTSEHVYSKVNVDKLYEVKMPVSFVPQLPGFVSDKSDILSDVYTSSGKPAKKVKKQNTGPVYNPPDTIAIKSAVPKDMPFADRRFDIRNQPHTPSKAELSDSKINLFSNSADQIAVLLHQEADLRGIER